VIQALSGKQLATIQRLGLYLDAKTSAVGPTPWSPSHNRIILTLSEFKASHARNLCLDDSDFIDDVNPELNANYEERP